MSGQGAPLPEGDELWRRLLGRRREASWGNFNWFSPRTLLMSLNDQVAKQVETRYDGGSIVDRRRMRWVASQRDRGIDVRAPVDLRNHSGMLVIGDPGEMDASQYVMVRPLLRWRSEQLDAASPISAAVLMSDVIYPAGDVNQWADAVYLPYFGLPQGAQGIESPWGAATETLPDEEREQAAFGPLWGMKVFALPGNHDWYDGLCGFMFNACGAEALPDVTYDLGALSRRQTLAHRLWKSPDAPKREILTPMRTAVAAASHEPAADPSGDQTLQPMVQAMQAPPSAASMPVAAQAAAEAPGMPNVPGPYYAVDLGRDERGQALLHLVMVDNGITGTIDPEQADWLERMLSSKGGRLPKIVVPGKPLAVGNRIDTDCPVSEYIGVTDDPVSGGRTLLGIVRGGDDVVASLAGDIHNYQRLVMPGVLDDATTGGGAPRCTVIVRVKPGPLGIATDASDHVETGSPQPTSSGVAPNGWKELAHARFVQLIAGGGGAFMHPTHRVRLTASGGRPVDGLTAPLEPAQHRLWPRRVDSVKDFTRRLTRGYGAVLILLGLALTAVAVLVARTGPREKGERVSDAWVALTLGPWVVVLTVLVATALSIPFLAGRTRRLVVGIGSAAALLLLVAATWALADGGLPSGAKTVTLVLLAVLAGGALLVPVAALVANEIRQVFSALGRWWPVRWGPWFAVAYSLLEQHAGVATMLALLVGGTRFLRGWSRVRGLWARARRESSTGATGWQVLIILARLLLPGLVLGSLVLLVVTPEFAVERVSPDDATLQWLSNRGLLDLYETSVDEVASALALDVLVLVLLVLVGAAVFAGWVPLLTQGRHALGMWRHGTPLMVAAGLDVALIGWFASAGWWHGFAAVGLVAGPLVVLGACVLGTASSGATPSHDRALSAALRRSRDGVRDADSPRGWRLAGDLCLAGVPSIESLAEAHKPPFFKNVVELRVSREGAATRIELVALGISYEHETFQKIETVSIDWMPH